MSEEKTQPPEQTPEAKERKAASDEWTELFERTCREEKVQPTESHVSAIGVRRGQFKVNGKVEGVALPLEIVTEDLLRKQIRAYKEQAEKDEQ